MEKREGRLGTRGAEVEERMCEVAVGEEALRKDRSVLKGRLTELKERRAREEERCKEGREGAEKEIEYLRGVAEQSKAAAQGMFEDPIVTEITAASTYYPAEDYHQDYYRQNGQQPYCARIIQPKLKKLGLE